MASKSRAPISGFLGDQYNNFLFAPICTEQHGRILSVVSLLARLDLDPWAQAAGFARTPRKVAISELCKMIARLPENVTMNETSNMAATRLIGLLPASNARKPARPSRWQNLIRKWRAAFAA